MILWTIQPEDEYENLVKTGFYHCRSKKAFMYENCKEEYDWLVSQMKQMVGLPHEGVMLPVWAWYQWEGVRKKPDLRNELFHDEELPLLTSLLATRYELAKRKQATVRCCWNS